MATPQRTLIFDIETKPMVAYVWDRRDVTIALNQLREDWSVIAWSAKWLGEPVSKVIYKDLRNATNYNDDKELLKPLWFLLDKADIVITQNGQSFDSMKLNARFILYGMKPPSSYRHFDTYRLASRAAAFTSTKLEYLTDKLCTKYKKMSHGQFPGMSLWVECLKGNKKAWNEMKRYNVRDTLATEELYTKLKAWAPKSFPDVDASKCDSCGKIRKLRVKCQDCGKWENK